MKITKAQLKQIIKEALAGDINATARKYKVDPLPAQFTNQQLIDFARQIDTNFRKFSPKLSTSKEAKPADMKSLEALLKLLTKRRAKEKDPKIQDEMQTVRLMLLDTINPDCDHREKYAYKQKMRADKLSRADRLTEPGRYGVYSKTPREELPTGNPRLRKFLGYEESLNRKQLEQIIREELESVMAEEFGDDEAFRMRDMIPPKVRGKFKDTFTKIPNPDLEKRDLPRRRPDAREKAAWKAAGGVLSVFDKPTIAQFLEDAGLDIGLEKYMDNIAYAIKGDRLGRRINSLVDALALANPTGSRRGHLKDPRGRKGGTTAPEFTRESIEQ